MASVRGSPHQNSQKLSAGTSHLHHQSYAMKLLPGLGSARPSSDSIEVYGLEVFELQGFIISVVGLRGFWRSGCCQLYSADFSTIQPGERGRWDLIQVWREFSLRALALRWRSRHLDGRRRASRVRIYDLGSGVYMLYGFRVYSKEL